MIVAITDNFTIKQFGHGHFFTIQNYHTLENTMLEKDDANIFQSELDNIDNMCKDDADKENKLDTLCHKYL